MLTIVLFWLVMNGALMRRELWLPKLSSVSTGIASTLSSDIHYREQWKGIYYEGEKVGYSNTTINKVSGSNAPGYIVLNRTFMVVKMLDNPLKVQFEGLLRTDEEFKMRNFSCQLKSVGHEISLDGRLEGTRLSMSVVSGGKVFRKETTVSEDVSISNSLSPLLYLPDLKPGVTYTLDVLNPISFATSRAKITITGMEPFEYKDKQLDVYVVETEYEGTSFKAWVTEGGEVLKEATQLGWTLLKEDRNVASDFNPDDVTFKHDFAKLVAVPSDVRIGEPEQTRKAEILISGIDIAQFSMEGAGQSIADYDSGLILIAAERPNETEALEIPIDDESVTEYLESTLLVQSDDAKIRQTAERIVGEETNSLRVAERINQWVFNNVNKKITFSLPSAVEVLETREGDCNEHTTLFVALARAVGLPSRIAIGLVYHKGDFYYHAWPEVYVGEWVAMDPTMGQSLADATHIRLLEGEIDQQAKLMTAIGKIKLSIKSFSYAAPEEYQTS